MAISASEVYSSGISDDSDLSRRPVTSVSSARSALSGHSVRDDIPNRDCGVFRKLHSGRQGKNLAQIAIAAVRSSVARPVAYR